MSIPDYDRRKPQIKTLHLSLPADLVKQLREVAYRKRRPVSHLCRYLIEAGMKKLVAEDPEAADAVAVAAAVEGPGGMDRRKAKP